MRRMNVQAVVQEVEQALHAVQANEVLVIEQEDGDNLVLIRQEHLLQLLGGGNFAQVVQGDAFSLPVVHLPAKMEALPIPLLGLLVGLADAGNQAQIIENNGRFPGE
jgi:hypothetical protein